MFNPVARGIKNLAPIRGEVWLVECLLSTQSCHSECQLSTHSCHWRSHKSGALYSLANGLQQLIDSKRLAQELRTFSDFPLDEVGI
jgi:hypothetical protein